MYRILCFAAGLLVSATPNEAVTGWKNQMTTRPSVPFIQKCHVGDDACVLKSAQLALPSFVAGLPEYNVRMLEPLDIETLDLSTPNLKLILHNVHATGVEKCQLTKMSVKNLHMSGTAVCNLKMESKYEIDGNLLFLSIAGKGDSHVALKKLKVNADADLTEVTGKDGKKHWKIEKFQHSYDLLEKSFIKMDNLFDGNAALSRAANELFATSPNEVLLELAPPFVEYLAKLAAENVNHFFKAIPIEDLAIVD